MCIRDRDYTKDKLLRGERISNEDTLTRVGERIRNLVGHLLGGSLSYLREWCRNVALGKIKAGESAEIKE